MGNVYTVNEILVGALSDRPTPDRNIILYVDSATGKASLADGTSWNDFGGASYPGVTSDGANGLTVAGDAVALGASLSRSCIAIQTDHATTVPTSVETVIALETARVLYGPPTASTVSAGAFTVPATGSYLIVFLLAYNSVAAGAAELVMYENASAFEEVDFQLPASNYNGAAFVGAGGSEIMSYRFDTLTAGRSYTARVTQVTGQDMSVYLPTGFLLFS